MSGQYDPTTVGNGLIVDNTTADSTDINPQLLAIQVEFDRLQGLIDRCFKTPTADAGPYIMAALAAARANKLAMFDASGNLTAANALPANLDAAGFTITQAALPVSPNDLVNLQYLNARVGAAPSVATSTTALTVGAGTKSLNVQVGLAFAPGQFCIIARTTAPTTTYMSGQVVSYDSGTGALVTSIGSSFGIGTFANWTVSVIGAPAQIPWATVAVNSVLMSNNRYTPTVDALQLTFPPAPAIGDQIYFTACPLVVNSYTLLRNGLNIKGLASDHIWDLAQRPGAWLYQGASQGWDYA